MLTRTASTLFRPIVEPHIDYFDSLGENLRKGKIPVPVADYMSTILFLTLLTFILSFLAWAFLGVLLPPDLAANTAYAFTTGFIIACCLAGAVLLAGFYYPGMKAAGIRKEIDRSLPFAAFYMATSASSGLNPVEIFRILSLKSGVIGKEAKKIYTNVKSLGQNLSHALQRTAASSPSTDFADLLWGLSTVVTSGGNLEEYLKSKTEALMNKYRRTLNDYSKSISLYTEIYITLVVVGTVLFIVLTAIMAPLAGFQVLFIQTFLVFFLIPLVSMAFIIILKSISPSE